MDLGLGSNSHKERVSMILPLMDSNLIATIQMQNIILESWYTREFLEHGVIGSMLVPTINNICTFSIPLVSGSRQNREKEMILP